MAMIRRSIASIVAVGLFLPMMGDAKEKMPLRLAPASPWNVHYADDSCRFGRAFGEGDQQITFSAERYDDGNDLRISFYGKSLKKNEDGELRLRFHPYDHVIKAIFYPATGSNAIPALVLASPVRLYDAAEEEKRRTDGFQSGDDVDRLLAVTPEQEAAITSWELSGRSLPHVVLETGSMGDVMATLRACTDQLLGEWGLDVARHKSLRVRARPVTSPASWITDADYPIHLAERGMRGIVNFRLMIDAQGGVAGCHIQQSTRPAEFDETVCKGLVRRAKFTPALDADGQPIPSYYRNSVRFSL
jgi:TonB family protein